MKILYVLEFKQSPTIGNSDVSIFSLNLENCKDDFDYIIVEHISHNYKEKEYCVLQSPVSKNQPMLYSREELSEILDYVLKTHGIITFKVFNKSENRYYLCFVDDEWNFIAFGDKHGEMRRKCEVGLGTRTTIGPKSIITVTVGM